MQGLCFVGVQGLGLIGFRVQHNALLGLGV